jgi:uncharacterized protein (DUF488 family)
MASTDTTIFSIGHSSHTIERFIDLLGSAKVTAIADVRTSPYSRMSPHFNRDALKERLQASGIAYSFLGRELGGRPNGSQFYCEGVADYERMAQTPAFKKGIQRVLDGAHRYTVALMCSERDPLDCHRCLLVSRALKQQGSKIRHIGINGDVTDHEEIEDQLLQLGRRDGADLFMSREEQLAEAYQKRARKVAYALDSAPSPAAAE